jgi:uncharacterized protein (TIGR00251 family)
MKISETKNGTIIEIFVKPNSPRFEVSVEDDEIVVRSTEEPERGKVNKEIVKELSKLFHSKTEIISGFTSKQKRLLIKGVEKSEVDHLLGIK